MEKPKKLKCRDCKWLCGEKHPTGIECLNPIKEWRSGTAKYKAPSGPACKAIEPGELTDKDRLAISDHKMNILKGQIKNIATRSGQSLGNFDPERVLIAKRGSWISANSSSGFTCSLCGAVIPWNSFDNYKYCPMCGTLNFEED